MIRNNSDNYCRTSYHSECHRQRAAVCAAAAAATAAVTVVDGDGDASILTVSVDGALARYCYCCYLCYCCYCCECVDDLLPFPFCLF